jgi:hypothetical protein
MIFGCGIVSVCTLDLRVASKRFFKLVLMSFTARPICGVSTILENKWGMAIFDQWMLVKRCPM